MSLCAKFHAFVPICAIHVFFRPNSPHYKHIKQVVASSQLRAWRGLPNLEPRFETSGVTEKLGAPRNAVMLGPHLNFPPE